MRDATRQNNLQSAHPTRLAFEFLWVTIGLGMATIGGAVGVRVITGVLSPAVFGQLTLVVTLAALVHQGVLGPLSQAFLRYFAPAQESDHLAGYWKAVQQLLAWATGVIGILALLGGLGLIVTGHKDWVGFLLGAYVLSLLFGIGSSLDAIQNAARRQVVVAWHQAISPWLRFLGVVAVVGRFGATTAHALIGQILGTMGIFVSQVVLFRRKLITPHLQRGTPSVSEGTNLVRRMRGYAWPFATWGVLAWFQMSSDRWALQVFHGAQTVGIYAALYQLGYAPMTMLSTLVLQLIMPVIFSRSGDGTNPVRLRSAYAVNLFGVFGTILATLLASLVALVFREQIFGLFVGPQYRAGAVYLPAIVLAGGLFASGQAASLVLMSDTSTRLLIRPKIVTAIVGLLLNIAGAYWFNIAGVVVANTLFGVVYFTWMAVIAWKLRPGGRSSPESDGREIALQLLQ